MQIDLLISERKFYSYEIYMANHLAKAFQAIDLSPRIIALDDGGLSDYLSRVHAEPPDWTIAFKPLLQLAKPLCDILSIPHFHWERRSLSFPVHLIGSSFGKVAVTDRRAAERFSLAFLPHGVATQTESPQQERPFDVVLFADLVDETCKAALWKELFSPEGVSMLYKGVELCLKNPDYLAVEAAYIVHKEAPHAISLNDLIFCIEDYMRAVKTRALIESFKGVRVDIFGEHVGNNWLKRLKNKDCVFLHSSLPYTEHFEVLKMSKILVRSQDNGSDGSDEWILPALNAGCLPLTSAVPYLEELMGKERRLFYEDTLMDQIHHFLAHPAERMALANRLKEALIPAHCFEKRAECIREWMDKA